MKLTREMIQRMVGAQPGGTVISGGGSSGGGGGTGSGTVTSVAMSVPTGFQISGTPITSAGTLALTFTSGYALPTTADVSKGVTAYGWGNHADAGYLTSSSLNGYATQQWVGQQGFLTSSALTGYATQSWVQQQGYLTSVPSGYATETWVQQQGFATTSQLSHYLALTGGTMENSIVTPGSDSYGIYPETDRYGFIGKSTNWYWNIYGSRLYAEKMELYVYSSGSRSLYGGVDNNNFYLYPGTNSYKFNVDSNGHVTAQKFVKDGGTSSQFLKADGSVDANTYLTSSSLTNYVQKSQTAGLLKNDGTVDTSTYLTSSALSGYATQQWVQQQGFITVDGGTFLGDRSLLFGADDGHAGGIYWQSTSPNVGDVVIDATGNIAFTINGGIGGGDITNSKFQISSAGCMLLSALQAFPYTVGNTTLYRITLTDANGIIINGRRLYIGNSYLQITNSGGGSVTQQADGDTYKFTANPNSGGQSGVTSFLFNKDVITEGEMSLRNQANSTYFCAKQWFEVGQDFIHKFCGYDQNGDSLSADMQYQFYGVVTATNFSNSSDARLKNIVSHAGFEVDKLATLPLVWFTWKKDERRRMHFGSIAQEWQKVLPEVVSENGDGMLAMDYGAAAMAAGVTACREIVRLKAEIERLKRMLN